MLHNETFFLKPSKLGVEIVRYNKIIQLKKHNLEKVKELFSIK